MPKRKISDIDLRKTAPRKGLLSLKYVLKVINKISLQSEPALSSLFQLTGRTVQFLPVFPEVLQGKQNTGQYLQQLPYNPGSLLLHERLF